MKTPITDIDGNVYKTVKIGNRWWMAENLKVTHYRNGDPIPKATSVEEWATLKTGAYCEYGNNSANAETYGRLYNWYAVNDRRKIGPVGWLVPSDEEWKELEIPLGMIRVEADHVWHRGTDQGSQLAGNADLWDNGDLENNAAFGSSGFAALPGGFRSKDGSFYGMGGRTYFWCASELYSSGGWSRLLYHFDAHIYRHYSYKRAGFSVRLVF